MLVTKENLYQCLQSLKDATTISLDTETTGLHHYKGGEVFAVICATDSDVYYFNFNEYEGVEVLPREVLSHIRSLFMNVCKTIFMANAKFDLHMLDIDPSKLHARIYDILVNDRLLFNTHLSYSLDVVAKRNGYEKLNTVEKHISENSLYEWQTIPGKKSRFKNKFYARVPFEIMHPYGEADARITYDIGRKQLSELAEVFSVQPKYKNWAPEREYPSIPELESRIIPICYKMERDGIALAVDFCRIKADEETKKYEEAARKFKDLTGEKFVDSGKALARIFEKMGVEVPRTAKGNPSITDEWLENSDNRLSVLIKEYRTHSKIANTYYKNYLYFADSEGILRPNMKQSGTTTGRFSYSDPNCLSLDTEILTEMGWKNFRNIKVEDKVAEYNTDGSIIWGDILSIFVSDVKSRDMVHVKNEHIDIKMTAEHRCLLLNRKSKKAHVYMANNFPLDGHLLHSGEKISGTKVCPDLLRLIVAIQADGYIKSKRVYFKFRKKRKYDRLLSILKSLHIHFSNKVYEYRNRPNYSVSFVYDENKFLDEKKVFTEEFLSLDIVGRRIFLEELRYWDGLSTRKETTVTSRHKKNVDIIQAVSAITNVRAHISLHNNTRVNTYHNVFLTHRNYSGTANIEIKKYKSVEAVWCIKTKSSFFVARRGKNTFVTGNCQNVPAGSEVRKAFIPRPNYYFASIDFSQQEFRMALDYAGELDLAELITNGHDPHTATADVTKLTRQQAKTLNFATLYGSGGAKIASMLGVETDEGKKFKRQYFKSLPFLSAWIKGVNHKAKTDEIVHTWAGRRLLFPDGYFSYKAVNAVIQGGCADVSKLAMLEISKFLKEKKSRMVLQVHDEFIFEIHESEKGIETELAEIMESIFPFRILKLTTSISTSEKSWGDIE